MSQINCQIYPNKPNIKVYNKESPYTQLSITEVSLDTDGKIVFVRTEDGSQVVAEDTIIYQDFLEVPGVGYLKPGTFVRLDKDSTKYVLLFGWHTNISNQTIYSWYLRPLVEYSPEDTGREYMSSPEKELSVDRTLYYDMINHIWEITPCNEELFER